MTKRVLIEDLSQLMLPRWMVACWVAGLCIANGRADMAEMYLTELMGLGTGGWDWRA